MYSGGADKGIRAWDAASGMWLRTFVGGHAGFVTAMVVSPDGQVLFSGDESTYGTCPPTPVCIQKKSAYGKNQVELAVYFLRRGALLNELAMIRMVFSQSQRLCSVSKLQSRVLFQHVPSYDL